MENCDKKCCEGGESKDCCKSGGSCYGMSMGGHGCHGKKYCLLKMVLKIVIIILIFWTGFKLGEMTGFIKANLGSGTGNNGSWMMRGLNYPNKALNQNNGVIPPVNSGAPVAPQL